MRSKIIAAARRFDNAVRKTVMDEAILVCVAVTDEWEVMDRPTARDIAKEITAEYPEGSRAARASEWAAFIYAAPFNLATAIRHARKVMPSFTRVDLFKLCRLLPGADSYKSAVEDLQKKKALKGAGKQRSIADFVKGLFNVQTRKRNEIKFRKELADLCAKYSIEY